MSKNGADFGIGILFGVLTGVLIGTLIAPCEGETTREKLKDAIDDFKDRISPELDEAKKQAVALIEESKCKLEKQYEKFNNTIKAQKMAKAKERENELESY